MGRWYLLAVLIKLQIFCRLQYFYSVCKVSKHRNLCWKVLEWVCECMKATVQNIRKQLEMCYSGTWKCNQVSAWRDWSGMSKLFNCMVYIRLRNWVKIIGQVTSPVRENKDKQTLHKQERSEIKHTVWNPFSVCFTLPNITFFLVT